MSVKLRQIARWQALCDARRRAAELALGAQMSELRRREHTVDGLAGVVRAQGARMGEALSAGELLEWRTLALQRGASERAHDLADRLRAEQLAHCGEARERLRERELETERAATRYGQCEQAERAEQARGEQARSDDRFAARKHWAEALRLP